MTTATDTATTTDPTRVITRARVGWGDLLWLTWRQHRWTVLVTAAILGVGAAVLLGVAWTISATGTAEHEVLGFGFRSLSQFAEGTPMFVGVLIAVFWAAPLLAREYEQRTNVVVWSQDLTSTRWLLGKMVLLGVPAVAFAAAYGQAVTTLLRDVNAVTTDYVPFRPFGSLLYEAVPLVQAGYAAFGFALGVAISAITRRTMLSLGLTLGAYVVVRVVVGGAWRPYFQTPLRRFEPYDSSSGGYGDRGMDNAMIVNGGYADAAGNPVEYPMACNHDFSTPDGFQKCMTENNVVNRYYDYHPAERMVPFQLIEFAIFTVLAAALLVLAYTWVKRSRRV